MIPKDGLYDVLRTWSGSDFQQAIDEYVSHKEYKTHDEALADGFSLRTKIYGVPLEVGRSFTKEQRDAWLLDYQKRRSEFTHRSEYTVFEKLTLNKVALREVSHCITRTTNTFGVNADLLQVGDCNLKVYTWYRPNATFDLPPRFLGLSVTGGQCKDPKRWFVTFGGWEVECWRTWRNGFQVTVNTSANAAATEPVDPLPDPGPMPLDDRVMAPEYTTTNAADQDLVHACVFTRPEMGLGKGTCAAPGPIVRATYDCVGEYCPWSYAGGSDNYDHDCKTCSISGDTLTFARYINSSAPGTATYKLWYKLPVGKKCVQNCDYGERLARWQIASKRNCGPGTK
jgi:hypothetical protein